MELKPARWWADFPTCPKCGTFGALWTTEYSHGFAGMPKVGKLIDAVEGYPEHIRATCRQCNHHVPCQVSDHVEV